MKKILFFILFFFSAFLFLMAGKSVKAADQVPLDAANPLMQYRENLTSPEPGLDQWIGGKFSGNRANGVVDSLIIKSISLTGGLPDQNGNVQGGIMGISVLAISTLFDNPPASGVTYFADLLHNAGFVKPVYAQGVGFSGLSPILTLWKATRNFSYLLITTLFIILGLMIMFRVKLSPQSVVSIQNAVPKIVMTLILITFSYAIAGLLIDLGNLILVLMIKVFAGTGLIDASLTTSEWLNAGIGNVFGNSIRYLFAGLFGLLTSPGAGWISGPMVVGGGITILAPILFAASAPGMGGLAIMAGLTLLAGICMAVVGLLLKIFIMMIKAYVSIILGVILGPIQIVFDALPGQKTSAVKSWAKSLLANILVFPTVALLFIICSVFDKLLTGTNTAIWTPPAFSGNATLVVSAMKIGVLLIIPNIDKMIMQALDVKTSLTSSLGREDTLLQGATKDYQQNYAKDIGQQSKTGIQNLWGRIRKPGGAGISDVGTS